ncbi:helix-turn-helix transcriptional regulator [Desulfosporosinus sp. FKA]|uniref:helix-turn-helix domain-containing protein n=1 Tax=Desulfosporosinus sp. FKA TaxID=1969834 RepID=UPI000B4A49A4|nr:helix-turn-helix transcriptional regulator [Desulfosporosinus sp. FKA]
MENIIKDRISKNLKYFRKLKGLTQEKLAEKINVSPMYISYLERSSKIPSLVILFKIADALNIEPGLLIQDNNSKNPEINKLLGIISGLDKSTIAFLSEIMIAFINFNNSKPVS